MECVELFALDGWQDSSAWSSSYNANVFTALISNDFQELKQHVRQCQRKWGYTYSLYISAPGNQ